MNGTDPYKLFISLGIYEKTFEIKHNYLLDIKPNYWQNNRKT